MAHAESFHPGGSRCLTTLQSILVLETAGLEIGGLGQRKGEGVRSMLSGCVLYTKRPADMIPL